MNSETIEIARLSRDPELLLSIFDERATCSDLSIGTVIRCAGAGEGGSILPSRAELDAIIAHGIKLAVLLDRCPE